MSAIVVGSVVTDLVFYAKSLPVPGATELGRFESGCGGKGFNQAVALARQGVETLFLGATGPQRTDQFTRPFLDLARESGLTVAFEEHEGARTGTAGIFVADGGQNSIVVALGANELLSPAFLDSHSDRFREAGVVLAQAECSLAAVRHAFTLGRELGCTTIFNPAPLNPDVGHRLLSLADIITPNETELEFLLRGLAGAPARGAITELGDDELHELCRRLGVPTVIVTLGAHGCFVSLAEDSVFASDPAAGGRGFFRCAAASVRPVDTTGAGDAFNGGLAAGLIRFPGSLSKAVRLATVVGGLSTERPGAAKGMPTSAEVDAFEAKAG